MQVKVSRARQNPSLMRNICEQIVFASPGCTYHRCRRTMVGQLAIAPSDHWRIPSAPWSGAEDQRRGPAGDRDRPRPESGTGRVHGGRSSDCRHHAGSAFRRDVSHDVGTDPHPSDRRAATTLACSAPGVSRIRGSRSTRTTQVKTGRDRLISKCKTPGLSTRRFSQRRTIIEQPSRHSPQQAPLHPARGRIRLLRPRRAT